MEKHGLVQYLEICIRNALKELLSEDYYDDIDDTFPEHLSMKLIAVIIFVTDSTPLIN